MPHQTVTSPCYPCGNDDCIGCKHELYRNGLYLRTNLPKQELDDFIENLWRECEDIVFNENSSGELVLGQPFHGFPVGEFTQDDWFNYIDFFHSKGVGFVYENISPYDFEK